jgi:hypothetical protein
MQHHDRLAVPSLGEVHPQASGVDEQMLDTGDPAETTLRPSRAHQAASSAQIRVSCRAL